MSKIIMSSSVGPIDLNMGLSHLEKSLALPIETGGVLTDLGGYLLNRPPYTQPVYTRDVRAEILVLENIEIE